ncbi:Uncharacterized protein DAT39_017441 [Clarias magur]|uniref:Uncharacterized protein n=1 Tax=Clarias magur TaxID=1594786 RepID=A0A8J4TAF6_CLAMG|nr:Uncharacterized protein DAT39_017441 [Clarias magur]
MRKRSAGPRPRFQGGKLTGANGFNYSDSARVGGREEDKSSASALRLPQECGVVLAVLSQTLRTPQHVSLCITVIGTLWSRSVFSTC